MDVIGNTEEVRFFPYNSELVQNEAGAWVEDRLYNANDWAGYFKWFISDGVYMKMSTSLQVEAAGGMNIRLRWGAAFADGHFYWLKNDVERALAPAHVSLPRRDIIIARHHVVSRTMQAYYVQGTPASIPLTPEIVRTDDTFDLQLCEIYVAPGSISITQENITDTRLDPAVCGPVTGLIDQMDTSTLFAQIEAALARVVAEWQVQKLQQKNDWETQTTAQAVEFNTRQSAIQTWYDRARGDIMTLQAFDFDNLAVLPGVTRATVFEPSGAVMETIALTGFVEEPVGSGQIKTSNNSSGFVQFASADIKQPDGSGVASITFKASPFQGTTTPSAHRLYLGLYDSGQAAAEWDGGGALKAPVRLDFRRNGSSPSYTPGNLYMDHGGGSYDLGAWAFGKTYTITINVNTKNSTVQAAVHDGTSQKTSPFYALSGALTNIGVFAWQQWNNSGTAYSVIDDVPPKKPVSGKLATRRTVFEPGGDVVETLIRFQEDGTTVRDTATTRTKFKPDGSVSEEVTIV